MNEVCDGLYCGGPFTESVAFLVLVMFAITAVIGLGISALSRSHMTERVSCPNKSSPLEVPVLKARVDRLAGRCPRCGVLMTHPVVNYD